MSVRDLTRLLLAVCRLLDAKRICVHVGRLRRMGRVPLPELLPKVARLIRALLKVKMCHPDASHKHPVACPPARSSSAPSYTDGVAELGCKWRCPSTTRSQMWPLCSMHAAGQSRPVPAPHFRLRSVQILARAHARGLAHGDLKAGNVMCSTQGGVQGHSPEPHLFLVDFAQSRPAHDSEWRLHPAARCLLGCVVLDWSSDCSSRGVPRCHLAGLLGFAWPLRAVDRRGGLTLIPQPAGVGRLIEAEDWYSTITFLCPSAVLTMSKEQCHLPADTMAANDVWQTGCLFWQLLTRGELAFCQAHVQSADILSAVREEHTALVSFSSHTCLVSSRLTGCVLAGAWLHDSQ